MGFGFKRKRPPIPDYGDEINSKLTFVDLEAHDAKEKAEEENRKA